MIIVFQVSIPGCFEAFINNIESAMEVILAMLAYYELKPAVWPQPLSHA